MTRKLLKFLKTTFNLKLLKVYGNSRIFEIFERCKIEKIIFSSNKFEPTKNLRALKVFDSCEIKNIPPTDFITSNFICEVKSLDELNFLNRSSNIKSLNLLFNIKFNSELNLMTFIENLTIENFEEIIYKLNYKFPNLKNLKVKKSKSAEIFILHKKLETLTFVDCTLSIKMNLIKTQRVKFVRCKFFNPITKLKYKIESSEDISEFNKFVMKKNPELLEISHEESLELKCENILKEPECKKLKKI